MPKTNTNKPKHKLIFNGKRFKLTLKGLVIVHLRILIFFKISIIIGFDELLPTF